MEPTTVENRSIMGVDPGAVSAAWGVIPWDKEADARATSSEDMPVVNRMVDARAFDDLVFECDISHVVVESVHSFPKQGVSSSFRFGMGYGLLLGVLATHEVEIIHVPPTVWKRHFKLGPDKEQARARAIERFPSVNLGKKKDAGRAEALLMALWLRETSR